MGYRSSFKKNGDIFTDQIVKSWEESLSTLATYLKYPLSIRRYINTSNALERCIKEVKRRTKDIEVFPHEFSAEKIIFLVSEEMNSKYQERKLIGFDKKPANRYGYSKYYPSPRPY